AVDGARPAPEAQPSSPRRGRLDSHRHRQGKVGSTGSLPGSAHMISTVPYAPERKAEWDAFVRRAKNGLFLFFRDYMDYHADRFEDSSLMFYEGDRLFALLPASLQGGVLSSHGGLTFGGVVC